MTSWVSTFGEGGGRRGKLIIYHTVYFYLLGIEMRCIIVASPSFGVGMVNRHPRSPPPLLDTPPVQCNRQCISFFPRAVLFIITNIIVVLKVTQNGQFISLLQGCMSIQARILNQIDRRKNS